jgi:hypothetical protein
MIFDLNLNKMKTFMLSLCMLSILLTISCNKDNNTSPAISTTEVSNTISAGSWRVTYYWDTDHEETANFSGYVFSFAAGNVLTATKTGSTLTGTWSVGNDDSKVKLFLTFTTPVAFVKISDDWQVIERTSTRIKLQDLSGINGGTDYLTFEKN